MMAILEKLRDQLNCSICLDTYTNPKQLQCHHVYCQRCLVRLVAPDQQGQLTLSCPNCRQVTPVPASGVRGLQAAFRVNQLLEIVDKHKKKVVTADAESTENTPAGFASSFLSTSSVCPEHNGMKVELYCETCGETICWRCIKRGSRHQNHDYEELGEAFERYKGEIMASFEPIEKQLVAIEKALAEFDELCDKISRQEATIEADIHKTITRLQETLDARKTELISQLHRLTQAKLKSLAAQRDKIETIQTQLNGCLHFMRENLKTSNQDEVLMMKKTTVRQVEELTSTFQPDMLKPSTEADVTFSALENLAEECRSYGQVYAADTPNPSECTITDNKTDTAAVGEKSDITLQLYTYSNQLCHASMASSISCELVSEIGSSRISGSVERRGESRYEISYRPTVKGRHRLHVKIDGRHIRGSPFPVAAKLPVENLGTPILTVGGVERPVGIAVNKKGEFLVTEWGRNCVSVFGPTGERLRSFGTRGSSGGQFWGPHGVAVDGKDDILVADCNNHRVLKFTAQGEFVTTVGTRGNRLNLQFDHPSGIAISPSGRVYVGSRNGCIQILNPDLTYFGSFGKKGSGRGQFEYPGYIACGGSMGRVYVADHCNHRIQVFTAEGKFLKTFGRCGQGSGELSKPFGIAVDFSDRVYISEWGNDRISVFTSEGLFVTSFGGKGEGVGNFECPNGLAVDSSGVVYVCDHDNNRIQLF